jgi:hypothetical protein
MISSSEPPVSPTALKTALSACTSPVVKGEIAPSGESTLLKRRARCGWFESLGAAISDSAPPPAAEPAAGGGTGPVVLEREGEGLPPGLAIAWAHRHLAVLAAVEPVLVKATLSLGAPARD